MRLRVLIEIDTMYRPPSPVCFSAFLIMHVCSNKLALRISIIEVTSGAPHKAKALGTKASGSALDLI